MVPEPASTSIPEPALAPIFNDHGTDAVIGKTCKIGTPLKLAHGGTLGARSFAKDGESRIMCGTKRHPDVEDSTTIYPNSIHALIELADGRLMAFSRNDPLPDQERFGFKFALSYTRDLGKS